MFDILVLNGFILAAFACMGNDVIQTLGTYLSSNRDKPNWMIWGFTAFILVSTVLWGYFTGDIAFNRLDSIPAVNLQWYHLIPPAVLLVLTRFGIPVSTTFLLLMVFSSSVVIEKMVIKSVCGYIVAFLSAIVLYSLMARKEEQFFKEKKSLGWTIAQWSVTAWLFHTWLTHDLANIFVFLPRVLTPAEIIFVLFVLVGALGMISFSRGGKIQKIVQKKTNTVDIRSATIIDLFYVFILIFFKEINNLPMSTTWVFIGFLAGRELGLFYRLQHKPSKKVWAGIGKDFFKVVTGLVVSVLIVYLVVLIKGC